MRSIITALALALLFAACTDPDPTSLSSDEQLATCGKVEGEKCDPAPDSVIGVCGQICANGFHPISFETNVACGTGVNNHVTCESNNGASFGSCGQICPPGYVPIAFGVDLGCGISLALNNHVTCERILRGDVVATPRVFGVIAGGSATTTLTWTTGGNPTAVSVRATGPGQPDHELATGPLGSVSYGPIHGGETHTIRLYGSGILLDTETIVTTTVVPASGTITASPQTVVLVGPSGLTTLTWTTQGVGAAGRVYRRIDGGAATQVASGAAGTVQVGGIQLGHSYRFSVHASASTAPELAAVVVTAEPAPQALDPEDGAWWSPARSGNGMDLRVVGNSLVFTWLTYDGGGAPIWYLSTLGRGADAWTGDVMRYSWDGHTATATSIGNATITVADASHATLAYVVSGSSGSESIERLRLDDGPAIAPRLSGLWYPATESGWGVDFDTSGSVEFAYLLAYAGSSPTWVIGSAVGAGPHFDFALTGTTGTNLCPGCTGPTSVVGWAAGTMSVELGHGAGDHVTTVIDSTIWQRGAFDLRRLL